MDVARALNFSSSFSNSSFVLRKHYIDLLYHFEKIYYFKVQGQLPCPPGPLPAPIPVEKSMGNAITYRMPVNPGQPIKKRKRKVDPAQFFGVDPGASVGNIVTGVVDGKFDNGYLITVIVGSERLNGILYHVPAESASPQFANVPGLINSEVSEFDPLGLEVQVTDKKRATVTKKDRNAARPARTGYTFFYVEQCARLKQNHSLSIQEISRMVADLWSKLSDDEKLPYMEQSHQDKERYRSEMMDYSKRLRIEGHDEEYIGSGTAETAGQENELLEMTTYYEDGSQDYHVSLDTEADTNSFLMHEEQELQTEVTDVPVVEHHAYSNQAGNGVYPVLFPDPQVSEFGVGSSVCLAHTCEASGDGYSYQNLTFP